MAIKKGQTREKAPAFKEMGTLRCDGCGEEFIVFHDPTFVDKAAAERQAQWLDRVLAEEHERERKHPDRIELPDWQTCSCFLGVDLLRITNYEKARCHGLRFKLCRVDERGRLISTEMPLCVTA